MSDIKYNIVFDVVEITQKRGNNITEYKSLEIVDYFGFVLCDKLVHGKHALLGNGILRLISRYLETLNIYVETRHNWTEHCGEPYQYEFLISEAVINAIYVDKIDGLYQWCISNNIDCSDFLEDCGSDD